MAQSGRSLAGLPAVGFGVGVDAEVLVDAGWGAAFDMDWDAASEDG